ncbi:MAG: sulfotransferase family protein [Rhodothermales bacterium]
MKKKTSRQIRKALQTVPQILTARQHALPDFLILGAQKAGSTSLYVHLMQHPQIIGVARKELHFFDYKSALGSWWYRTNFPTKAEMARRSAALGKPVLTGEASPYYLFHPHAARRIARLLPDVKLIALLRNPVDRAFSHYHHEVRGGRETLSLEEALAQEPERLHGEVEKMRAFLWYRSRAHQRYAYRARGLYIDQLLDYDRYFDRDQMLILPSEAFYADTQAVYSRVLDFLGLDPFTLPDLKPRNAGQYAKNDPAIEAGLHDFFEPHNQRLFDFLGEDFGWRRPERLSQPAG